MTEQDAKKLKQVVVQVENDVNSMNEDKVTLRQIQVSPTQAFITPPQVKLCYTSCE